MAEKISKFVVDTICSKYSIEDFLSSIGIELKYKYEDKLIYICPLHKDSKPSFVVYTSGEFQTYYCFGCQSTGNIISLYSKVKNISFTETINQLGGYNVSNKDEINFIVDYLKKKEENSKDKKDNEDIFSNISLNISRVCYDFLIRVNFDIEEQNILEKLYKKIDNYILLENIKGLLELYFIIIGENKYDKNILMEREKIYEDRKNKIDTEYDEVYKELGITL